MENPFVHAFDGGSCRVCPCGRGLAVARGLGDAVDATSEVDGTPGGGLTMIVTVPVAYTPHPDRPTPKPAVATAATRDSG